MKTIYLTLFMALSLSVSAFHSGATSVATVSQAWEKLGSRVVTMTNDHDEILVTASEGVFTAIQLRIMKAPIHLTNINIIFGNGENENVVFDKLFPAGSETRVIDLTGNN